MVRGIHQLLVFNRYLYRLLGLKSVDLGFGRLKIILMNFSTQGVADLVKN